MVVKVATAAVTVAAMAVGEVAVVKVAAVVMVAVPLARSAKSAVGEVVVDLVVVGSGEG